MAEAHLRCCGNMNKGRFESFTDGVFAFAIHAVPSPYSITGAIRRL